MRAQHTCVQPYAYAGCRVQFTQLQLTFLRSLLRACPLHVDRKRDYAYWAHYRNHRAFRQSGHSSVDHCFMFQATGCKLTEKPRSVSTFASSLRAERTNSPTAQNILHHRLAYKLTFFCATLCQSIERPIQAEIWCLEQPKLCNLSLPCKWMIPVCSAQ